MKKRLKTPLSRQAGHLPLTREKDGIESNYLPFSLPVKRTGFKFYLESEG
ncbi:MAG: hypothetical protein K9N09_06695 [Candidatus Cloacimonetes bacterium]|nr:hypothetical protein [Candidatus Cloacimonadota bacterium]MCF7815045.1 hypothetical protein [Candidatus Cloacimonadota bacterium]MCF7868371.1 hypothetical protein [Candidatus Cloacimonadota bacterium]MCF7883863.1 hypothetical protein [Candidatus Cloacimonadota bacterium]